MFSRLKIRTLLSGLIFLLLFQSSFAMGAMDWSESSATETISICTVEGSRTITLDHSGTGTPHSSHCHCNCAPCGGAAMATLATQILPQRSLAVVLLALVPPAKSEALPSPHFPRPPSQGPPLLS